MKTYNSFYSSIKPDFLYYGIFFGYIMQLYAYDRFGQLILSTRAQKKLNYRCLECGSIVRLREGVIRHSHFYHLNQHSHCRQNGKSPTHLQLQVHLKNLLPEASLEHRFQEISRIADVAWHSTRIIFEIQCSSLSREEMEARVRDYASIGYQVVWILHDTQYNQWRLSALEYGLKGKPHYYTNMNPKGDGIIYDQWQHVERGKRKQSLPPLAIDPRTPYTLDPFRNSICLLKLPFSASFSQNFSTMYTYMLSKFFKKSAQKLLILSYKANFERGLLHHQLGFQGDIRSLPKEHPYLIKIKEKEEELATLKRREGIWRFLNKTYVNLMKSLLKPYCD